MGWHEPTVGAAGETVQRERRHRDPIAAAVYMAMGPWYNDGRGATWERWRRVRRDRVMAPSTGGAGGSNRRCTGARSRTGGAYWRGSLSWLSSIVGLGDTCGVIK